MRLFQTKTTLERVNEMLDKALEGSFEEEQYDESQFSRLEAKWMRYLAASEHSRKELEKERTSIEQLVTDISHQTKTPLSNIILYSQLLQELEQAEEAQKLAEQIGQQSEKLQFLIEALIKTSRLESGTFQIRPEKNKMAEAVSTSIRQVEKKAQDRRIELQNRVDQELIASFDLKWTVEALFNILDNAIKYSPEKSRVTISAEAYEIYAAIKIRDQGTGIAEEEIPKIFGRFYRGEDVHAEEGTGIGLYLSRQIIEAQNGYITVRSKLGEGSEFQVYLLIQ